MSLYISTAAYPECFEINPIWTWSVPMTVAVAFKSSTNGTNSLVRTGHTGVNDNYGVVIRPGYTVSYDYNATNLSPTATFTPGAWSHFCGISRGSTDHSAYVNGGGRTNSTTSFGTPAHDRMRIGAGVVENMRQLTGYVENVAIWNAALTDEEVYSLGALFVSPLLIRPQSLVACYVDMGRYAPTALIDSVGGYHSTAVYDAPERSDDNPPTVWRPRRRLFVPSVAASPFAPIGTLRQWEVRTG